LFGKMKTGVFLDSLSEENVLKAMHLGKTIVTDGPVANLLVDYPEHKITSIGRTFSGKKHTVSLEVRSSTEYGSIDSLKILMGIIGKNEVVIISEKSGTQQYLLSGEYSPTRYNSHSDINYDGAKAAAIWHWTATDLLAGTAGYRYSQSLRNFANQLAPKRIIDLRTENHVFAGADYDLPENWKVGARGDFADVNFNNTTGLDIQRTTGGANLNYISRAGNTMGFDAQYTHGSYKNSPVEDFNEYTIGPTVEWKFTVRTQLKGNLGYTERSYTNNARKPAYGNVTGRFTLTIADAGRGSLSAALWRELSNLGDEIAEYTIVDGISLDPAWTLSNGLTARVHGSYEHRDFKVVSGVESDRIDDVGNISGFLDWPLGRHFKLSGGATVERRSSTRYLQSYQYLQQQLQIVGTL
jgi:hypothetical protein